jgi:maltose O-acetyltransferase
VSTHHQSRKIEVLLSEIAGYHPRYWLMAILLRLIPSAWGPRIRAAVYRAAGWNVGPKTLIMGSITVLTPQKVRSNLRIGSGCFINSHVSIDAGAPVVVGDGVAVGHHVVIITTNHEFGPPSHRAGGTLKLPVTIEDGAWIASGVTILPGVTIGAGAVVAAGAVVTRDVVPNTLVGGLPAKVIRTLEND